MYSMRSAWIFMNWLDPSRQNSRVPLPFPPFQNFQKMVLARWPLTLKIFPLAWFFISTTPCGKTVFTIYGPVHLDFNLPRKRCRWELYKRTFWLGSKVLRMIFLSWKVFSYKSRLNSSSSFICSFLWQPT